LLYVYSRVFINKGQDQAENMRLTNWRFKMKKIIALAVAAVIATPAMADLTINGSSRYTVRTIDGDYANDGRVQFTVAGSTTTETGAFVAASGTYNINMGAAESTDDVKIAIGNAAANVTLGEFEKYKAFNDGPDAFQAGVGVAATTYSTDNSTTTGQATATAGAITAAQGYEGDGNRARNVNNVALNVTAIEGVDLQLNTTLADTGMNYGIGAGTSLGGIALKANYEVNDGADNGWGVSAGGAFGDVSATLSAASNGTDSSTALTVGFMGLSVQMQKNKSDTAGIADVDHIFGAYTISDVMGVAGASLMVGAGNADDGTNSVDELGARISYAF